MEGCCKNTWSCCLVVWKATGDVPFRPVARAPVPSGYVEKPEYAETYCLAPESRFFRVGGSSRRPPVWSACWIAFWGGAGGGRSAHLGG